MIHQGLDVFDPFPERQKRDGHGMDPVMEVFSEASLPEGLAQVLVGGGDDSCVQQDGPAAAHPLKDAAFDDPEQLDLKLRAQFADLAQKEGTTGGQVETAGTGLVGAGRNFPPG